MSGELEIVVGGYYVPQPDEWVRVVETRPETKPGFGCGSVVKVQHAEPSTEGWLNLWSQAEDMPLTVCRVVPADALDLVFVRRRTRAAWREFGARLKQGLPARRAPYDWEPPDDYEVFRRPG